MNIKKALVAGLVGVGLMLSAACGSNPPPPKLTPQAQFLQDVVTQAPFNGYSVTLLPEEQLQMGNEFCTMMSENPPYMQVEQSVYQWTDSLDVSVEYRFISLWAALDLCPQYQTAKDLVGAMRGSDSSTFRDK